MLHVVSCFLFTEFFPMVTFTAPLLHRYFTVTSLLTLRLLMSYIFIFIYIYMERLFLMFLDHTQRRSTVGRTPLWTSDQLVAETST